MGTERHEHRCDEGCDECTDYDCKRRVQGRMPGCDCQCHVRCFCLFHPEVSGSASPATGRVEVALGDAAPASPASEAAAANRASGLSRADLIDFLDVEVTGAIIRAERMADSGDVPGAAAEFAKVARTEARLADLHPADELEGFIAREGAVSAYVKAGERSRAESLAAFYQRDPKLGPDSRDAIRRHLGLNGGGSSDAPDGAGGDDGQ